MQESLQTADASVSISGSGCINLCSRFRIEESQYNSELMQESLDQAGGGQESLQTAYEGDYFRQRFQESLYLTANARDSISYSGCKRL